MKITTSLIAAVLIMVGATSCSFCSSQKTAKSGDAVDMHNSKNSLDWAGTYKGVLPAADTEGMGVVIVLRSDQTYSYYTKYAKSDNKTTHIQNGKFNWKDGNTIVLESNEVGSKLYAVEENMLKHLDIKGNEIKGDHAKSHELIKSDMKLTETYWKLTELSGEKIKLDANFNREPHLIFKEADKRVTGNAGCNSINGAYTVDGNNLTFGMMVGTLMACPNLEIEGKFMKIFEIVKSYSIENDYLFLKDAQGKELAKMEAVYLY